MSTGCKLHQSQKQMHSAFPKRSLKARWEGGFSLLAALSQRVASRTWSQSCVWKGSCCWAVHSWSMQSSTSVQPELAEGHCCGYGQPGHTHLPSPRPPDLWMWPWVSVYLGHGAEGKFHRNRTAMCFVKLHDWERAVCLVFSAWDHSSPPATAFLYF